MLFLKTSVVRKRKNTLKKLTLSPKQIYSKVKDYVRQSFDIQLKKESLNRLRLTSVYLEQIYSLYSDTIKFINARRELTI